MEPIAIEERVKLLVSRGTEFKIDRISLLTQLGKDFGVDGDDEVELMKTFFSRILGR